MATERIPHRERRPSVGAPLVDIQGGVSPAGVSRPKHKRTFTGFGAGEIKHVEGKSIRICQSKAAGFPERRGRDSSSLLLGTIPVDMA